MERETGFEPATSSLGIQTYFESKSLARLCCELLNLQHLAESAFSQSVNSNEARTRQASRTQIFCFYICWVTVTTVAFSSRKLRLRNRKSPFLKPAFFGIIRAGL